MKSMFDPNVIPELIGKPHDGEMVLTLFKELSISWEDVPCIDRDIQHYIWTSEKKDIQLDFFDEGFIFDKRYHDLGEGSFILDQVVLWGYDSEAAIYSGLLVNGVQFTDTQEMVLQKMGAPAQKSAEFDAWSWQYENYKINIGWTTGSQIGVIGYRYTPDVTS